VKNKNSTYLLIFVFIAIWGIIGFRFFNTLDKKDLTENIIDTTDFNIMEVNNKKDSFQLIKNYNDPFLKKNTKSKPIIKPINISSNNTPLTIQKPIVPKIQKPILEVSVNHIKYYGLIKNQDKGKKVGVLYIDNNEHLITENIVVGGVEVKTISENEIQINFQEKMFTIEIEK